jgi:Txe/YoeB family toxin of Txe-Axe toxin-antitoxin module
VALHTGLWGGSLDAYPGHYTQGCDIAELEEMLTDLYTIRQEEEARLVYTGDENKSSGIISCKGHYDD